MREAILRDRIGQDEAIDRLADHYRRHDCDGLFLSAVTYQGVQLPIRELVQTLGDREKPRFVVVDGAQALNHIPLGLGEEYCDLLLAGCHKWLRAYQPLGLAFCCRRSAERLVAEACAEMLSSRRAGRSAPGLHRPARRPRRADSYSETVNLAPLFTAAAAVRRMLGSPHAKRERTYLLRWPTRTGWRMRHPQAGWQPGTPGSAHAVRHPAAGTKPPGHASRPAGRGSGTIPGRPASP